MGQIVVMVYIVTFIGAFILSKYTKGPAKAVMNVAMFMSVVLLTFATVGKAITNLTGGEPVKGKVTVEISPEGGEKIFWGKGRCFTCHSLGGEGSAVRCPNLGVLGGKFDEPIGVRMADRAKQREAETGEKYTPTDYLIESIGDPGAYIVKGYKDEMAIVYAPPISLNLDEIKAVISYLQSQGGEVDTEYFDDEVRLTDVAKKFFSRIAAAADAGGGDPGHGEVVFFEEAGCSDCHTIDGFEDFESGTVGPNLTTIGKKGLKSIQSSVLTPTAAFTEGYETYTVIGHDGKELVNEDGLKIIGVKVSESAEMVEIAMDGETTEEVSRADIKELQPNKNVSIMPNITEELTVKDYQDLVAFLLTQKGKEEEAPEKK